ncbi:MAG: hypothetical protein FWF79_02035 [Defluviitaleaceae bacterium]|nr:hypothetical protein [Defluviitaleaceae bacterium]
MKRVLGTILAVAICVMVAIQVNAQSLDFMNNVKTVLYFDTGYGNSEPYQNIIKITSVAELTDYYNYNINPYSQGQSFRVVNEVFLNARYDDVFFESSFLIFIELEVQSGSTQIRVSDVREESAAIDVVIERVLAELSTADEVHWNIILEMDRALVDRDFSLTVVTEPGFGNVPNTSVPGITGHTFAMIALLGIAALGINALYRRAKAN